MGEITQNRDTNCTNWHELFLGTRVPSEALCEGRNCTNWHELFLGTRAPAEALCEGRNCTPALRSNSEGGNYHELFSGTQIIEIGIALLGLCARQVAQRVIFAPR